jgi:hypothetical protein
VNGAFIYETGTVEGGDTLSAITLQINEKQGTNYTYQDIARINKIANPNKISVGQIIGPSGGIPDITQSLNELMQTNAQDNRINWPWYFKEKVQTGGDWDLKNTDEYDKGKYKPGFIYDDEKIDFDAPGNIHYGFVGKATLWATEKILLWQAGKAHVKDNSSKPEWIKCCYGDDPRDRAMIQKGFKLYDKWRSSRDR